MSKISKALEKAARDRTKSRRKVTSTPVTAPIIQRSHLDSPVADSKVDPHIVTYYDRQGIIAEQYRMLRTQLQSMRVGSTGRALLMTGALHNEGKTVTSVNLALTLSQQPGCKVLLIDADLRKASVKRWLGLEVEEGLGDALVSDRDPADFCVRLKGSNLMVLPAGTPISEPSEHLHSKKMKLMIERFKQQFDYVIIDSPPVLLLTDAVILSQQVDGVVFIARAGGTSKKMILEAQDRLHQVNAKMIGTILTHAEYYNPFYAKYYRAYYQQQVEGEGGGEVDENQKDL